MLRFFSCLFLLLFITSANAQITKGVVFDHKDWMIVCENTLTCRAVGYNNQDMGIDDNLAVSILLERKAGANQSLVGYVQTNIDEQEAPKNQPFILSINNKQIGSLEKDKNGLYKLTQKQVSSIIQALKSNNSVVTFHQNNHKWVLSNAGFNAVMLKMDEVQGRVGTLGAIIKSGKKNESQVYPPIPAPVIKKIAMNESEQSKEMTLDEVIAIFPEFKEHYERAECEYFDLSNEIEPDQMTNNPHPFRLIELDKHNELLEAICWLAAYNTANAYWVIPKATTPNDSNIHFVTNMGSYYSEGNIHASHKGRGLGDCWEQTNWVWDGNQFMLSAESTTGLCRGFAGGAWDLPYFVSEIK